jgi:diphthamide synthase (EF-2-diphthine--ammonia ligase)
LTLPRTRVLLSWSSGIASAWALHVLRQQADIEIVGLLTDFNEVTDRSDFFAECRELVEAQAAAVGLPLIPVMLPHLCPDEVFVKRMRTAVAAVRDSGVTHMALTYMNVGDLIGARFRLLEVTGLEPLFPIWNTANDNVDLARQMLDSGIRAVLTCVDPKQLDKRFVGRQYDTDLLEELPAGVDPCGEWGEFHTFCYRCPEYRNDIQLTVGDPVERDGSWFADLRPAATTSGVHPG